MPLSPYYSGFPDLVYLEINDSTISKTYHFSNVAFRDPGLMSNIPLCQDVNDYLSVRPQIYANGVNSENEGYVSLFIHISSKSRFLRYPSEFTLTCIMSVIGIDGNQRFSQSLTISDCNLEYNKMLPTFGFDKFVKLETLLSEQLELLPKDILTIKIYFSLKYVYLHECREVMTDYSMLVCGGEKICWLPLNSIIVQTLSQVSDYFRRMLDTPMQEKMTGSVKLSFEEFSALKTIVFILKGRGHEILETGDIYMLYIVTDKYGIKNVGDKCREIMKNTLCYENYQEILYIAQLYEDNYLKEAIEDFLKGKNKDTLEGNSDTFYIREKVEEEKSKIFFKNVSEKYSEKKYHLFINDQKKEIIHAENSDFNFYK